VLLALTFVIRDQVEYGLEKPMGFDPNGLMTLPLADDLGDQMDAFRQEAERLSGVASVAQGIGSPLRYSVQMANTPDGGTRRVRTVYGQAGYAKTVGFSVIDGRTYTNRPADSSAVLVNETAARAFNLRDRLGEPLSESTGGLRPGDRVVGIVEDFHSGSLHDAIQPTVIRRNARWHNTLVLRLQPDRPHETLQSLQALWHQFAPNHPFVHRFADDAIAQQYAGERTLSRRLGAFALLAVLVAGLGLFGLAAFTAEQRTKEVGIRKVLGASIAQIVLRLNREFALLVGVAFVAAVPVAAWLAVRWLRTFAYRIDLSPGLFVLAGGLTLGAALLPVSYHALRAASVDPARTLRSE